MKRVLAFGAVTGLVLGGIVLAGTPALAATLPLAADLRVTNGNDSGPGSLRQALADADALPEQQTIVIEEGLEIHPKTILESHDSVRLVGEGLVGATIYADQIEPISDQFLDYVLEGHGSLSIENLSFQLDREEPLTLWGGINWYTDNGGSFLFENSRMSGETLANGIEVNDSDVSSFRIRNSTFEHMIKPFFLNTGAMGPIEISGNTFSGIQDFIYNDKPIIRADQQLVITDNSFEFVGEQGKFSIRVVLDSTEYAQSPVVVSGNHILDNASYGTIIDVFIEGSEDMPPRSALLSYENNSFERPITTKSTHPMIMIANDAHLSNQVFSIRNSTFVNPTGGLTLEWLGVANNVLQMQHVSLQGGIGAYFGGELNIQNSVLDVSDQEVNIDGDLPVIEAGNVTNTELERFPTATVAPELLLGELSDGGLGKSKVRIPLAGSPVIGAGVASDIGIDQRGIARPQGAAPDAGAVEVRETVVSIGDAGVVNAGETLRFPVTIEQPGDTDVTISITTADGTATAGSDYTQHTQTLSFAAASVDPQYFEVSTSSAAKLNHASFSAVATLTSGEASFSKASGVAMLLVKTAPKPQPQVDPNTGGTKKPLPNTGYEANANIWLLGGGLLLAGLVLALARRRFAK